MHRFLASLMLAAQANALKKVLVTGAGGRTGKLVFEQLKADDNYKPVGLARSSKAQKALSAVGATTDEVVVADIADEKSLAAAMAGCDAVVLCTSAVPAIKPLSLMKTMATKVLPFVKTSRPSFKFPKAGTPEEVDWLGAKMQIDAAKAAGVKRFVFVSSMVGTQPDNFLNSIGRQEQSPAPTTPSSTTTATADLHHTRTCAGFAHESSPAHRRQLGLCLPLCALLLAGAPTARVAISFCGSVS